MTRWIAAALPLLASAACGQPRQPPPPTTTIAFATERPRSTVEIEHMERLAKSWGWVPVRSAAADKFHLVVFQAPIASSDRLKNSSEAFLSSFDGLRRLSVVETKTSIRIPTGEWLIFFSSARDADAAREAMRKEGTTILEEARRGLDFRFRVRPPLTEKDVSLRFKHLKGAEAVEEDFVFVRK